MGAGYSVSAITDFAGDDLDMLSVKSRLDDGQPATMPATCSGRGGDPEADVTRGNDPCTDASAWRARSVDAGLPHFLLEFTPGGGAEIQSEYLMARRYASSAIEALRELGPAVAPLVKSPEIERSRRQAGSLRPISETYWGPFHLATRCCRRNHTCRQN